MASQRQASGTNDTLARRIVTALAVGASVLAALLVLPPWGMATFLLLLGMAAADEWAKLIGLRRPVGRIAFAGLLATLAATLWRLPDVWWPALNLLLLFWVAVAVGIWRYPAGVRRPLQSPAFMLCVGLVVILGTWLALTKLHVEGGAAFIVWLIVATTLADTGAYFAGRRFGRRKLAPTISPGKTWEGALGGALTTLLWGAGGAWFFGGGLMAWLAVAVAVFAAALLGDLFESALKRAHDVKDSGTTLPGHGGILDRIDSLTAAAPVFAWLSVVVLA